MPELRFQVESVGAIPYAAAPMLAFKLRVHNAPADEPIAAVSLACQIRIEPGRRSYQPQEKEQLSELFGSPDRWGQSLRPLLWTHAHVDVPGFVGAQTVDLQVPCSYDFNLAATKYFAGLESGEAPLLLLFSGTVFYEREDGALQASQIAWSQETTFRLPVSVWREMMELYYPNTSWLCLRSDTFDRLRRFKTERGLLTWEQAIEALLESAQATPVEAER
jgi:hypothetical protein